MSDDDKNEREALIAAAVGEARDVLDPLEELLHAAMTDGGAPFAPDILELLRALRRNDPAKYERLRAKLKDIGVRVTALDQAVARESGEVEGRGVKQADILIELARPAELFHAPDGTGFADLDINGHRETWPIRSKGFRRWLTRSYYEAIGGAPNSEALQSALNVIESTAHYDGPERTIHIRVGRFGDQLYLDLCDEKWRAIEIDNTSWRVVEKPPVRFRRAAGMQPLPVPMAGGSIESLRAFLNVQSQGDFVLVVAWLVAALRTPGPYPVLVLSGEQGSAKSTFSKIVRALVDPNTAPLRALPREDRDLFISASNGHMLAFDNVSGLRDWISDTLCRLATGGGFAVRQLYTDQDEVLFDAMRPMILNGIEDIVERPDLADRAVLLTLEPIPEERRRPEAEISQQFETERPRLLGALLDAVVEGLRRLPETRLPKLPRMADFALWATACETAMFPAGSFWTAYNGNRDEAVEVMIEADAVAAGVIAAMATFTVWKGTATELLAVLSELVGERITKSKNWPGSPRALSGRVRRASPLLRKVGIEIDFDRAAARNRGRLITITKCQLSAAPEKSGVEPSAPSAPSANVPSGNNTKGLAEVDRRTVVDDADGSGKDIAPTVRANL